MQIPCVGAIVVDDDGRLLLVKRAHPPAQGMWSIPGGRVEPGESDQDAVVRELQEETGLLGTIEREVGTIEREAPSGGTYVIRDFLLRVESVGGLRAGDDAADAAWFTPGELRAAQTSPGLMEALVDWHIIEM